MTPIKQKWLLNARHARKHNFTPLQTDMESITLSTDYQQNFDGGYVEGERKGFDAGQISGEAIGEKKGYADGYEKGIVEGKDAGAAHIEQQLNTIIPPITALKELLEEGYNQQIQAQQQLILALVKKVAQQVIRCELTLQPQQILSLIEETLAAMPADGKAISIHLEPSAVAELKLLATDKIKDWTLIADPSISSGGCRIVSDNCDADASIETRLNTCIEQVEQHLDSIPLE